MFHRVKTETSTLDNAQQSESEKTDVAVKDVETSPVSSETDRASSYTSSRTTPARSTVTKTPSYLQVSNTKEENQTMSDLSKSSVSNTAETKPASPYQKTPASSASTPSGVAGYTPSYTSPYASQGSASTPAATEAYSANDRKLTIGRGITMSGEIESCDHLFVEGTVEAALKGAQLLEIAESGVFYGTVEISEATIAGRFEGDITVSGRLTIESGGVVTGTISYGELQVESGAIIDGRLTPASAQKVEAAAKAASAPQSQAAPAPAQKSEGALFESA